MGLQRRERREDARRTATARGGRLIARLYTNENVALEIVEELRRLGHDALRVFEAGRANQKIPDPPVLAYADQDDRIVVTGNRQDFIRLHRGGQAHKGIVVFTDGHDPVLTAGRIHAALMDPRAEGRFLARVDGVGHRFDP